MEFRFGNQGTSTMDSNWIGTDASYFGALGNGLGVLFHQHTVNVISLSMTDPNTIAFSGGRGVVVDGADLGTSGQQSASSPSTATPA